VKSLAEIDPRKVAEVVRRLHHENNASATHFRALSVTYGAISLETWKA